MEAEEVDVCEITFDCWWEVVLVDLVEDVVEVGGDRWNGGVDNVDEDVNGVRIDSCPLCGDWRVVSLCRCHQGGRKFGEAVVRGGGLGLGQGVCIVC